MRILMLLMAVLAIACATVFGQVQPPPVADNASPQDRSLKDRSIEMERVRRDEKKGVATGKPGEVIEETRFKEIKEDFEQIQVTQGMIVAAYQKGSKIDFRAISTGAEQISKRGTRLKGNLFPEPKRDEKKKKNKDKDDAKEEPLAESRQIPEDVRSLIAEIDNTLALFTANSMFSNSRVANADDHAKAKRDLEHIVALSNKLQTVSAAQIGTPN